MHQRVPRPQLAQHARTTDANNGLARVRAGLVQGERVQGQSAPHAVRGAAAKQTTRH